MAGFAYERMIQAIIKCLEIKSTGSYNVLARHDIFGFLQNEFYNATPYLNWCDMFDESIDLQQFEAPLQEIRR